MADFRVFATDGYTKDLESLRKAGAKQIISKLDEFVYPQLREEPRFGPNIKKLTNWEPDAWRYRVGDWRFFFEIDEEEKMVYMTAAYHRGEAYR